MRRRTAHVEISDILPFALTLVVAGMGIAFGVDILDDTRDDIGESVCAARTDSFTGYSAANNLCTNTSGNTAHPSAAQFNATTDTILGVAKFSDKMGLIATVIVAALVISLLVRYLFMRV